MIRAVCSIKRATIGQRHSAHDEQKKSAEQLLAPHVGMMAMMAAMGSGQMMGGMGQRGTMGSSQMPMMPGNPMTTGKMPPQ